MYDNLIEIKASLVNHDAEHQSAWRKIFKADYIDSFDRFHEMKLTSLPSHRQPGPLVDLQKGTCSCTYFVTSRFLLCSHICGPQPVDASYFTNVKRFREPPFWRIEGTEWASSESSINVANQPQPMNQPTPGEDMARGQSDLTLNEAFGQSEFDSPDPGDRDTIFLITLFHQL
jgi:hypothetical protein